MDGLDELLKFPSGAMYGGGYQDDFYVFMQDLDEPPVQVHTEPVILTAKKPRKDRIPAISEFYGQAALANTDIIAINGPGALKILSNPSAVSKEINPFIFLLTSPQRYDDINEIITKQIAFICLFHHLFFFAKRAKFPSFPTFIDGFPDKFAALQSRLGQEKDTKKEVFSVRIADLTNFWDNLKNEIGSNSKETIFNMLELLSKTPKEIYDYLLSKDDTATIVASQGADGSTQAGFDALSSVQGTIQPPVPPVPPHPPAQSAQPPKNLTLSAVSPTKNDLERAKQLRQKRSPNTGDAPDDTDEDETSKKLSRNAKKERNAKLAAEAKLRLAEKEEEAKKLATSQGRKERMIRDREEEAKLLAEIKSKREPTAANIAAVREKAKRPASAGVAAATAQFKSQKQLAAEAAGATGHENEQLDKEQDAAAAAAAAEKPLNTIQEVNKEINSNNNIKSTGVVPDKDPYKR